MTKAIDKSACREFVLASGNAGKLREIEAMLSPLGFHVRPQQEWRIPEAAETASTFVENSLIKARQAARITGLPSIADDSGLVVPALNGEPGIYSARYAGSDADDEANMQKLLENMSGLKGIDRNAYFFCAMVLVESAEDPAPMIATGRWYGTILSAKQGGGGFGYDPVFGVLSTPTGAHPVSAAELSPSEKGRVSHRGRALRSLVGQIREENAGSAA